ncbi:hypothetical protein AB0I82_35835 [Streptomyces sp. NPDC050315]|uniref:hypothetical protein n=1 Tax=Streptomyces sp. NPDC050315 TaxID=3155039 RepID=UPI0034272D40
MSGGGEEEEGELSPQERAALHRGVRWPMVVTGLLMIGLGLLLIQDPYSEIKAFQRAENCRPGQPHNSCLVAARGTVTERGTIRYPELQYALMVRRDGERAGQTYTIGKGTYDVVRPGDRAALRFWRGELVQIRVRGQIEKLSLSFQEKYLTGCILAIFTGVGLLLSALSSILWVTLFDDEEAPMWMEIALPVVAVIAGLVIAS